MNLSRIDRLDLNASGRRVLASDARAQRLQLRRRYRVTGCFRLILCSAAFSRQIAA